MAGHFHDRGAHHGEPHAHRGLYLFVFAVVAILAFAWTRQPVDQLLPIPSP
jgi:hypothetical protein